MVTGLGMSCSRSNGCGRETRAPCVKIELFVSANDMPRGLSFSRKCFFFSSRRPHTSWNCDWSSDVCSSDLVFVRDGMVIGVKICEDIWYPGGPVEEQVIRGGAEIIVNLSASPYHAGKAQARRRMLCTREIGRASCRERVETPAVGDAARRAA